MTTGTRHRNGHVVEEVENLLEQGAMTWEIASILGIDAESVIANLRRNDRMDLAQPFIAAREREKVTFAPPRHWSSK